MMSLFGGRGISKREPTSGDEDDGSSSDTNSSSGAATDAVQAMLRAVDAFIMDTPLVSSAPAQAATVRSPSDQRHRRRNTITTLATTTGRGNDEAGQLGQIIRPALSHEPTSSSRSLNLPIVGSGGSWSSSPSPRQQQRKTPLLVSSSPLSLRGRTSSATVTLDTDSSGEDNGFEVTVETGTPPRPRSAASCSGGDEGEEAPAPPDRAATEEHQQEEGGGNDDDDDDDDLESLVAFSEQSSTVNFSAIMDDSREDDNDPNGDDVVDGEEVAAAQSEGNGNGADHLLASLSDQIKWFRTKGSLELDDDDSDVGSDADVDVDSVDGRGSCDSPEEEVVASPSSAAVAPAEERRDEAPQSPPSAVAATAAAAAAAMMAKQAEAEAAAKADGYDRNADGNEAADGESPPPPERREVDHHHQQQPEVEENHRVEDEDSGLWIPLEEQQTQQAADAATLSAPFDNENGKATAPPLPPHYAAEQTPSLCAGDGCEGADAISAPGVAAADGFVSSSPPPSSPEAQQEETTPALDDTADAPTSSDDDDGQSGFAEFSPVSESDGPEESEAAVPRPSAPQQRREEQVSPQPAASADDEPNGPTREGTAEAAEELGQPESSAASPLGDLALADEVLASPTSPPSATRREEDEAAHQPVTAAAERTSEDALETSTASTEPKQGGEGGRDRDELPSLDVAAGHDSEGGNAETPGSDSAQDVATEEVLASAEADSSSLSGDATDLPDAESALASPGAVDTSLQHLENDSSFYTAAEDSDVDRDDDDITDGARTATPDLLSATETRARDDGTMTTSKEDAREAGNSDSGGNHLTGMLTLGSSPLSPPTDVDYDDSSASERLSEAQDHAEGEDEEQQDKAGGVAEKKDLANAQEHAALESSTAEATNTANEEWVTDRVTNKMREGQVASSPEEIQDDNAFADAIRSASNHATSQLKSPQLLASESPVDGETATKKNSGVAPAVVVAAEAQVAEPTNETSSVDRTRRRPEAVREEHHEMVEAAEARKYERDSIYNVVVKKAESLPVFLGEIDEVMDIAFATNEDGTAIENSAAAPVSNGEPCSDVLDSDEVNPTEEPQPIDVADATSSGRDGKDHGCCDVSSPGDSSSPFATEPSPHNKELEQDERDSADEAIQDQLRNPVNEQSGQEQEGPNEVESAVVDELSQSIPCTTGPASQSKELEEEVPDSADTIRTVEEVKSGNSVKKQAKQEQEESDEVEAVVVDKFGDVVKELTKRLSAGLGPSYPRIVERGTADSTSTEGDGEVPNVVAGVHDKNSDGEAESKHEEEADGESSIRMQRNQPEESKQEGSLRGPTGHAGYGEEASKGDADKPSSEEPCMEGVDVLHDVAEEASNAPLPQKKDDDEGEVPTKQVQETHSNSEATPKEEKTVTEHKGEDGLLNARHKDPIAGPVSADVSVEDPQPIQNVTEKLQEKEEEVVTKQLQSKAIRTPKEEETVTDNHGKDGLLNAKREDPVAQAGSMEVSVEGLAVCDKPAPRKQEHSREAAAAVKAASSDGTKSLKAVTELEQQTDPPFIPFLSHKTSSLSGSSNSSFDPVSKVEKRQQALDEDNLTSTSTSTTATPHPSSSSPLLKPIASSSSLIAAENNTEKKYTVGYDYEGGISRFAAVTASPMSSMTMEGNQDTTLATPAPKPGSSTSMTTPGSNTSLAVALQMPATITAPVRRSSLGSSANSARARRPKRMVDLIRQDLWSQDATVVEGALKRLHEAALNDKANYSTIARTGGLLAIVQAMENHLAVTRVQVQACKCLETLAIEEENELAIGEVGGVEAILDSMMEHFDNETVQEAAWSALWNLSCHSADEQMLALESVGGFDVLVKTMLRHSENAGVQKNSCGTLANLCVDHEERKTALADAGGLVAIATALQIHWKNMEVRKEASYAMTILLGTATEDDSSHESFRFD